MTDNSQIHPVSMTKPLHPTAALPPGPHGPHPTQNLPVAPPAYGAPYASPVPYPPVPYQPAPVAYPSSSTTVLVQQSNAEIIVAWIFTALTLLYMLPWAIAASRRSTNSVLIAIATFFLGWTFIGWLVLLVLSCLGPTTNTVQAVHTYVAPPVPMGTWAHHPADPPHVQRWFDGVQWTPHTTVR